MKFNYPITIFAFVCFIITIFGGVYAHELSHVEIYRGYGIESHISWTECFPDVCTIAEEPCTSDSCTMAHGMAEATFYPAFVFFGFFGFFAMMVVMLLEERNYYAVRFRQ